MFLTFLSTAFTASSIVRSVVSISIASGNLSNGAKALLLSL